MADEQIDPADSRSVGSKLGDALVKGIQSVATGLGGSRDTLREISRNMLTSSIATSGSNMAILSGDPTYAIEAQKRAANVDRAIQQHWWITKAKDFQKEKLKPAQQQFNALQVDFNTRISDIQKRFGDISAKYGVEQESRLTAVMEDLQSKGATPEEIEKIAIEKNKIQEKRNDEVNKLSVEYSSLMSEFNTAYGSTVMNIMNEATLYDPDNPILGNMINGLVGVISAEAESFSSRLSTQQEGRDAALAADQTNFQLGARPTMEQQQRVNEARTLQGEASADLGQSTARQGRVEAEQAERELGKFPDNAGRGEPSTLGPLEKIHNIVQDYINQGKSEAAAIEGALENPDIINSLLQTDTFVKKDARELFQSLGYGKYKANGEIELNEDLITEEGFPALNESLGKLIAATKVVMSANPNMTIADATDYLDDINIDGRYRVPTAITIIQERAAKDGIQLTPGEIIAAMDEVQEKNPNQSVAAVVKKTLNAVLSTGKKATKETEETEKGGVLDWFRSSRLVPKLPSKQDTQQSTQQSTVNKPAIDPAGLGLPDFKVKPGVFDVNTNTEEGKSGITPRELINNIQKKAPEDHGKVYGALLKLRQELQMKAKTAKEKNKDDQATQINERIKELDAFIKVYNIQFPVRLHKEMYDIANKVFVSKRTPDSILTKYGF